MILVWVSRCIIGAPTSHKAKLTGSQLVQGSRIDVIEHLSFSCPLEILYHIMFDNNNLVSFSIELALTEIINPIIHLQIQKQADKMICYVIITLLLDDDDQYFLGCLQDNDVPCESLPIVCCLARNRPVHAFI